MTEFSLPTANSFPDSIVSGPDGALWFTESAGNQIGRMTTDGAVTEFFIPTFLCNPVGITSGPDGNLWFTENVSNKIGRITTTGEFTEFPIPTPVSAPIYITAGADGNLWFTEGSGNKIGRITPAGEIDEFPVPTFNSFPAFITLGPDGNVWFSPNGASQVGRVTPAGVITMFPLPIVSSWPQGVATGPDGNLWLAEVGACNGVQRMTASGEVTGTFALSTTNSESQDMVAGPDGNMWFTENVTNRIARITLDGSITEFSVPTPFAEPLGIAVGPDGNIWFTESSSGLIGRLATPFATPRKADVDFRAIAGSNSNVNGVLESGESVEVAPFWTNTLAVAQPFSGSASNLTGPPGPTYTIDQASADYGTAAAGATVDCDSATGNCYRMSVSGARPAAHWDVTFTENLSFSAVYNTWTIHIGGSFTDLPTSNPFYYFVEMLFHSGVTGGCGAGVYCPDQPVTRAQSAILLLKTTFGSPHLPPPASGNVFSDVHIGDFAADWIEELARLGITGGCGSGMFCPDAPVSRKQMAVMLLKTEHGATYVPPACAGVFADVTCPSAYADWIEQAFEEGFTGGCGGGNYCPEASSTRAQTAVFLDRLLRIPGPPPSIVTPTPTPTNASTSPTRSPTPTTTGGMCGPGVPACPSKTPTPTPTP